MGDIDRVTKIKPRRHAIEFILNEDSPVSSFSISLNPWAGKIQIDVGGKPKQADSVKIEHYYERAQKPKVITRVATDPKDPHIDLLHALSHYDLVFAVDTNTPRDMPISITAVICGKYVNTIKPALRYFPLGCFEFRGVNCPPERLGWATVMQTHLGSTAYQRGQKCCFIVDAHLGELDDINSRIQPVIGDFFLPPNFSLDYATDASADNIQNMLIKLADHHSRKLIKLIRDNPSDVNIEQSDSPFYEASRWWKVTDNHAQQFIQAGPP